MVLQLLSFSYSEAKIQWTEGRLLSSSTRFTSEASSGNIDVHLSSCRWTGKGYMERRKERSRIEGNRQKAKDFETKPPDAFSKYLLFQEIL
jgi:hypothetical protein